VDAFRSGLVPSVGGWDASAGEAGPDGRGNVCFADKATAIHCAGTLLRSETTSFAAVGIRVWTLSSPVAMGDAVAGRVTNRRLSG